MLFIQVHFSAFNVRQSRSASYALRPKMETPVKPAGLNELWAHCLPSIYRSCSSCPRSVAEKPSALRAMVISSISISSLMTSKPDACKKRLGLCRSFPQRQLLPSFFQARGTRLLLRLREEKEEGGGRVGNKMPRSREHYL